jgi:uncharacterized membrane protein
MAVFYVGAGINHFIMPLYYMAIMPPYIPWHLQFVYITGACEILIGLLLIPKSTRRVTAWILIGLLIAIFPANIQMTINYANEGNPGLWYTILRLPVQLLLIWWAWIYTKPVSKAS